jgi:hypothetical protein
MTSAPFCASRAAGFGFLRIDRDRLAVLGQECDLLAQFAESEDHGLAALRLGGGGLGRALDRRRDGLDLLLDRPRQFLRFARALLGGLRQGADLVRHHRKAAPVVAGSRGFDRLR